MATPHGNPRSRRKESRLPWGIQKSKRQLVKLERTRKMRKTGVKYRRSWNIIEAYSNCSLYLLPWDINKKKTTIANMAKRGAGGKEKEAIVSPVVNPRFHSGVRTSPLWSVRRWCGISIKGRGKRFPALEYILEYGTMDSTNLLPFVWLKLTQATDAKFY